MLKSVARLFVLSLLFVALVLVSAELPLAGTSFPRNVMAQSSSPSVVVEPAEASVAPDQEFSVTIAIEGVAGMKAYEFTLMVDPAVVELVDAEDGGFLASTGYSLMPVKQLDAEAGRLTLAAASMGDADPPEGSGDLAVVTLKAVGAGETALDLQDVKILNPSAGATEVDVGDGKVSVGATGSSEVEVDEGADTAPEEASDDTGALPGARTGLTGALLVITVVAVGVIVGAVLLFGRKK